MAELKHNSIRPVYLLQGTDKFLQRYLSKKIADSFFQESHSKSILLIPDEMKSSEIIDRISSVDLFSAKHMFVLVDPQKITGTSRTELLAYCDSPIQSNCLVIIAEEFRSKRAIIKELTKRFKPINISSPFEQEMKKWIQHFFKNYGISANPKIVNVLFEIAGDSVNHVANEIEKLSILLTEGQELAEELVQKFAGWKKEHRRFEFFSALGNKDLIKAVKIGMSLIRQQETMISLIYPLTAFFQELLFTKLPDGGMPGRNGWLPLPPSAIKNLHLYAKKYSRKEIEQAINLLADIERRSKTSVVSDDNEMTKFLFGLLGNSA